MDEKIVHEKQQTTLQKSANIIILRSSSSSSSIKHTTSCLVIIIVQLPTYNTTRANNPSCCRGLHLRHHHKSKQIMSFTHTVFQEIKSPSVLNPLDTFHNNNMILTITYDGEEEGNMANTYSSRRRIMMQMTMTMTMTKGQ